MSELRGKLNDIELELDDLKNMTGMTEGLINNMFVGPNDHGMFVVQRPDRELAEFALRDIGGRVENILKRIEAVTEALEDEEVRQRKAA